MGVTHLAVAPPAGPSVRLVEAQLTVAALVALLTPIAEVGLAMPPVVVAGVLDELRVVRGLLNEEVNDGSGHDG